SRRVALSAALRGFLERHAELLRALPAWTVRLLVPIHKADAIPLYKTAFHEQLALPLRPSVLDDVRWYLHRRRRPPKGHEERFGRAYRFTRQMLFRSTKPPFTSSSRCPCDRPCWTMCGGTSTGAEPHRKAPTSGSITPRARSARRGFERCIAHGSNVVSRCWMP